MKKNILEQLGLSTNEALVYNTLLSEGELQPPYIAEKTELTRTNTYALLKSLVKKGLIEEFKKKNKLHYRLEPPQKLKDYIESQKKNLEQSEKTLEVVLPSLTSEYNLTSNKPSVIYFEGLDGLKKVYLKILEEKKEILSYFLINPKIEKLLRTNLFQDKYFKTKQGAKIPKRSLIAKNQDGIEYRKKQKSTQIRLIPQKKFPFSKNYPIEKNVCGNKVALIYFKPGKISATLIENEEIAQIERTIFDLAWEAAEKYNK